MIINEACGTKCVDPLWCIERQMCKSKRGGKDPEPTKNDSPLNLEILGLVRHKSDVHYALETLFRSCAPQCIPAEDTMGLICQIDNAIAGYRSIKPMPNETTARPPTMNSLMDWHVGQMSDGFNEVRFVLADNDEARAWAIWIASQEERSNGGR